MRRVIIAAVVALAVAPVAYPATSSAAPVPEKEALGHCVVHVVGEKDSGELELSEPRCYATQIEAMTAEGVEEWGPGAAERAIPMGASFTIGSHCDPYSGQAPCMHVTGDNCDGGWLNVSAAWNNRISSTIHGCPTIRHYDDFNLQGSSVITFGPGIANLTSFNNQTASIQYFN